MGRLQPLCHKTKSCKYHAAGRCKKGPACTFAHGAAELLPRPVVLDSKARAAAAATAMPTSPSALAGLEMGLPLTAPVLHPPGMIPDVPDFPQPPRMLPMAGDLRLAEMQEGLLTAADISPQDSDGGKDGGSEGGDAAEGEPSKARTRLNKFHKTQLCMFHQMGKCKKRASCRFAHGLDELRPVPDLYRTKLCPTMLEGGKCEDPECRFAHSTEELRYLEEDKDDEDEDEKNEAQEGARSPHADAALQPPPRSAPPEPARAPAYIAPPAEHAVAPEVLRAASGCGPLGSWPGAALPVRGPEPRGPPVLPPEPCGVEPHLAPGSAWPKQFGAPVGNAPQPQPPVGLRGFADEPPVGGRPWRGTAPQGFFPSEAALGMPQAPRELGEYQRMLPNGRAPLVQPQAPLGAGSKQLCPALLNLGKCPDPFCAFAHRLAPPTRQPSAYPNMNDPYLAQPGAPCDPRLPGAPEHLPRAGALRDAYRFDWSGARGLAEADEREQGIGLGGFPQRRAFEEPRKYNAALEELQRRAAAQASYAGLREEHCSPPSAAAAALAYLSELQPEQAVVAGRGEHPGRLAAEPPGAEPRVPRLRVKNTFLTVQDEEPPSAWQGKPRSRTLPVASIFDEGAEEIGGMLPGEDFGLSLPRGLRVGEASAPPAREAPGLGLMHPAAPKAEEPWPVMLDAFSKVAEQLLPELGGGPLPGGQEPLEAAPDDSATGPDPFGGHGVAPGVDLYTLGGAAGPDSYGPGGVAGSDPYSSAPGPDLYSHGSVPGADLYGLGSATDPDPYEHTSPSGPDQYGLSLNPESKVADASPVQEPLVPRLRVKNTFLTVDEPARVAQMPRSRTLPVPSGLELEELRPPSAFESVEQQAGLGEVGESSPSPPRRRGFGLARGRTLLPQIGEAGEGVPGLEPPPHMPTGCVDL